MINKRPLLCKIKLINHLLLHIYLIWELLLILARKQFLYYIQNYYRDHALPLLFMFFWNFESKNSSINRPTSSSQLVCHSYNLRSKWIEKLSSSSTRSTSNSISALLRHHARPNSSTSENHRSSLSDIPISLKLSSGNDNSFTIHSYPRYHNLTGGQESVSSLSAFNPTDLP